MKQGTYEENRRKASYFSNEEVWNEIIRIKDDLGIVIDYVTDDSFVLVEACDAFRIFIFGKLDDKWICSSLDYWDVKKDIASEIERVYFKRLVDMLNDNETSL